MAHQDLSAVARSGAVVTRLINTNANTWTLVTVPEWCRVIEISNTSGAVLSYMRPATTEGAAYNAASDHALPIPSGAIYPVDMSSGAGKPEKGALTLSVHTAASAAIGVALYR